MNKEYFTDNLSFEDIVEMTDKMLRFEKSAKSGNIKSKLLKIIPAAAVFLFAIGIISVINHLPFANIKNKDALMTPGAVFTAKYGEISSSKLTIIPKVIEKETFDGLMACIPKTDKRIFDIFHAYYVFIDDSIYLYNDLKLNDPIYLFDINASEREIANTLEYWNYYTDWTDQDYFDMLEYYGLFEIEENAIDMREMYEQSEKEKTLPLKFIILDGYEITIIEGDGWTSEFAYKDDLNTVIDWSKVFLYGESVIGLPGDIILKVPENTVISGKTEENKNMIKITIGDGGATIIGPESVLEVMQGTVIDVDGNIINIID